MDVPAPASGAIESLTVAVGDKINSGDVIGTMTVEVGDTVVIDPRHSPLHRQGDTTILATPAGGEAPRAMGKQTLVVPDLGDFEDVDVIEVHISDGQDIVVDDPLVTLETDKAAMDVPAVVAGTIDSVLVKVGNKVSEGSSLAIIDAVAEPGETPSIQRSCRGDPDRFRQPKAAATPIPSQAKGARKICDLAAD